MYLVHPAYASSLTIGGSHNCVEFIRRVLLAYNCWRPSLKSLTSLPLLLLCNNYIYVDKVLTQQKKKHIVTFVDRYGSVFKSHIFGSPTVISMDQDLNRYILMNEGKGLVPGYPKSMLDLVGKTNIAAVHGAAHKYIRGSLLSLIGSEAIKDQLFPDIDKFMRSFINNWEDKTIDIQDKTIEVYIIL